MEYPYTTQPLDALMAAQTSVGLVLGSAVWLRGWRPRAAAVLVLAAIAIVVVLPMTTGTGGSRPFASPLVYDTTWLREVGVPVGPTFAARAMKAAAALATIGALLTRRRLLGAVAFLGEALLWLVTDYIQDSEAELAGAHLAFFGLLVGLAWRTESSVPNVRVDRRERTVDPSPLWRDDVAAFVFGTLSGALVCRCILHGWTDSADEWAYTFEAALFAKLRAYGSVPACAEAFRNFWVFQYQGRSFAQYTPGWPYFMAPFVALRVPWLAGPASLGLLGAAVARLGRRAAAGFSPGAEPPSDADVRAAGRFAALVLMLASTVLINGGSRFSHVFVAAAFAWSLEALFTVAAPGLRLWEQRAWGAVLGLGAGLMISARPADGATLGLGLLSYFGYVVARRRVGCIAVGVAVATFAAVTGVTLIILRLQLQQWFTTGYSIAPTIHEWVKYGWSLPVPAEYRWGIPLMAGAYCAQPMAFVFFVSYVALLAIYTLAEFGRNWDFGYGPRFQLPCVVPMAVGTGVVLARMWSAARVSSAATSALRAGGPAAVALVAVVLGVVRIAPLVYPYTLEDVRAHSRVKEAIELTRPHNAVVFAGAGTNNTSPLDLTENYPLDLYPDEDVLIANETAPSAVQCVRAHYPGRSLYRAEPGIPVRIVPLSASP